MADAISIQELIDARTDAKTLEEAVNGDAVTTVLSRLGETYPTLSNALNQIDGQISDANDMLVESVTTLFTNGGLPATPFKTKALMTASSLANDKYAQVTDDADNNGLYVKTAGAWVKSEYDPFTKAVLESIDLDKQLLQKNKLKEFKGVSSDIIPMYSDYTADNVVLGYKKSSDSIVGVGLVVDGNKTAKVNEVQAKQGLREHTNDSADILPLVSDVTGTRVVLGYDKTKGKLVGNFDSSSYNKQNMLDNYNMVMFAGQSLAGGSQSKPSLSVNSKYATSLTFDNTLFAKKDSVSFVPLVEADYTNTGESPLSGFANYVLTRAQMNYGIDIDSHNLLTTGAGLGSSPIEWHKKGERVYEENVIPQIHNALNVAPNIALRAVCWLHGETSQTGESPKEHYYNIVKSVINDINTDVTQYTKQDRPVRLITYQISYKARIWDGVTKAHLQLVKDDVADLASPTYRFACASDGIHLTNEGSKLAGCYFARTYTQRIFGNRKPDWVEPLYATLSDDTIRVKFKVPQLPLRFETTELPSVVDNGVAVHVNGVTVDISTLTIEQDTLVIKLSETPTGDIRVKYGYDYGTNKYNNFLSNAAGNLVDSTDEKVNINNKEFTMFHCSPHFDLPITTLEI